jgi:hypothetical protein
MSVELEGSATAATAGAGKALSAGPAAVVKSVAAFTLAHPLGVLGFTGAALVLLGIYDAVQAVRERKRVPQASNRAETSW